MPGPIKVPRLIFTVHPERVPPWDHGRPARLNTCGPSAGCPLRASGGLSISGLRPGRAGRPRSRENRANVSSRMTSHQCPNGHGGRLARCQSIICQKLYCQAVAAGHGKRVKKMMEEANLAESMEPLWHAVRAELGEELEPLPAEIMDAVTEVGSRFRRSDPASASNPSLWADVRQVVAAEEDMIKLNRRKTPAWLRSGRGGGGGRAFRRLTAPVWPRSVSMCRRCRA